MTKREFLKKHKIRIKPELIIVVNRDRRPCGTHLHPDTSFPINSFGYPRPPIIAEIGLGDLYRDGRDKAGFPVSRERILHERTWELIPRLYRRRLGIDIPVDIPLVRHN